MKKLKLLKGLTLSSFVGLTAVSLVACGGGGATHSFTSTPTNVLTDNNSPLNGTFNNSPTSTYAQTALYGLTTYQTTGKFVANDSGEFSETTKDTLILEGASAVLVFANENVMKDVDNKLGSDLLESSTTTQKEILEKLNDIKTNIDKITDSSNESEETADSSLETKADASSTDTNKWTEGTDYWVFTRDKGGIQFQKGIGQTPDSTISQYYNDAVSKGLVYQFVIDTDNKWVDGSGKEKQSVSSKDFERGLESYALASAINYTRNSYFLDLIGLGTESLGKTVSYKSNDSSSYASVSANDYDVDNFANKNDAIYTMYIDEPYPYALDLISKEYFGALPNTNQKVKNISLKNGKIKVNNGKIDTDNTDFSSIFGSGGLGQFTSETWYAGAYYVAAFTSSQIIFNLNSIYMDTVGQNLLSYVDGKVLGTSNQNTDDRMEKVVINYGSGTPDTYFENFKAGQIDYLSSVPEAKRNEANSLGTSVVPIKVIQTTQSNYIAYTPNPYVVDDKGQVTTNLNIDPKMAQFIYQWDDKDAITVRAGIAGLVNYYSLASLVYSNSQDFQLSATPYGAFNNYYESVAKGNIYGALPRKYEDYKNSKDDKITSEFKIPYYSWSEDDQTVKIENITINEQNFKNSINTLLSGSQDKLNFSIKFGEGSFSTNYQNYLNQFKSTVEALSENKIQVNLVLRDAVPPTANDWYNNQSSPLGFSYWSPDYNGVGTWIEADNTLESKTVKKDEKSEATTYEGVPGTNAHNSFHTFLTNMVYAVKLMKYTWNSSNNKYEADTSTSTTTSDPYSADDRIQKAFGDSTLTSLGIKTDDSSFNSKTTPGERFGTIAIELLNLLIEKGVFDQTKLSTYINNPSLLEYSTNAPKDPQSVYLGGDVIKSGQSANFSKYLGIFAGQSTAKALYENTVLDSDYSFIPRPEAGLNERVITLVNPNYVARSGTQSINYRDFGVKK